MPHDQGAQAMSDKEILAQWMMQRGYATGHGDTMEDLLVELDWQIAENWNRAMINGIEAGRKDENEEIAVEFDKRHEAVKHRNNYFLHAANYVRARREQ